MVIEVRVDRLCIDVFMDILIDAHGSGLPSVHRVEDEPELKSFYFYIYVQESHEDRFRELLEAESHYYSFLVFDARRDES